MTLLLERRAKVEVHDGEIRIQLDGSEERASFSAGKILSQHVVRRRCASDNERVPRNNVPPLLRFCFEPMQFIREYQIADPDICDALIRCFEECRTLNCVHRGRLGLQKVRLELKNSYDLSLSNIPPSVRDQYKNVFEAYFTAIGEFATDYMRRFPHLKSHTRTCNINESPNIQHYPPEGGFFEEHYENAGPTVAKRVLTFQSYLNDVQEGGGTRFVYQDYVAKPARGKTVLWPAGYTHVHCGEVAPREDKYIITGWWSYDEPAEK